MFLGVTGVNIMENENSGVGHVWLYIFGKISHRFTRAFTNTDKKIQECLISFVKNYFNRNP